MRIPLWARLFLTFAALSVAGVIALTLLQRRTFQRDFLDYVNQQAAVRVERAALELGKRYEQIGHWRFLAGRPRTFEGFLDGTRSSTDLADDEGPPRSGRPPDRGPRGDRGPLPGSRPPPGDGQPPRGDATPRSDGPPFFSDQPDDRKPPKRPARQTRIDALNLQTRVALFDDQNRLVIGNPAVPPDSPSVPIRVANNVVGRLLIAPQPALDNDVDVAFVRSQSQHATNAAIGVLLASLLAAWLLARWLLSPVKTLDQRMQQLAAGNYHERIKITRNDELGELAQNYNRLADTLAKNQEARRSWGADIAHELRTPLSILRGEIQALQDGIRPFNRDALDSLQAECGRLTGLVEDLYQLALSDAGALTYRFEIFDLNELVREIESEHAWRFRDAGLTLTTALNREPLMVRADHQRLVQLFGNLLTNCRRYTDAPGSVRITTQRESNASDKTAGNTVDLVIEDSPPGVPPESMPRLFDRLYRVESSRSRAAGGAGLGLTIARNIAEAHSGRLVADVSPLGGLRMRLSLPAAASQELVG